MAKKNSLSASPKIFKARLLADGGVQKVREITRSEAIVLRQSGRDVVVCGGDLAANRTWRSPSSSKPMAAGSAVRLTQAPAAARCHTTNRKSVVPQDIRFMKRQVAKPADARLKFFTRELYVKFNSADAAIADAASDEWERAVDDYQKHLRTIEKKLPAGARTLAKLCLHDAELMLPKPGFASLPDFAVVSVAQRIGDEQWKLYLVIYSLSDRPMTAPSTASKPFSKKQVHWLYDELDVCGSRSSGFIHRVLFSDGRVLAIPFTNVAIQTMTAHAASRAELPLMSA